MPAPDVSDVPLQDLLSLSGRAAVVTGAAKGIGEAIARRAHEAGCRLVLGDLDEAGVKEVATSLDPTGQEVVPVALDVADTASVVAAAERCTDAFGRLDGWVNNAGIFPPALPLELEDAEWDRVLDVDLRGTFVGAREAARRMVGAGGGVIVNISSTAGFRAPGGMLPHYVSAKHGVVGLTKSLAVALGPQGVRVLGVAPTLIDTPGVRQLTAGADEALAALVAQVAERLPLGRAGVPDDVARVVLFCLSDASAFMTGSTLLVDAGDLAV